jgi:hypothetical protein
MVCARGSTPPEPGHGHRSRLKFVWADTMAVRRVRVRHRNLDNDGYQSFGVVYFLGLYSVERRGQSCKMLCIRVLQSESELQYMYGSSVRRGAHAAQIP